MEKPNTDGAGGGGKPRGREGRGEVERFIYWAQL